MAMSGALKFPARLSEASDAGDKFVRQFYENFDKRRHLIKGFYSDSSFMVWNGHTKSGVEDISTFYQNLPSSQHSIQSLDCQPVLDDQSHTTVLVCCEGEVCYDGQSHQMFTQNFLLVKQSEYWKVGSDCFRFFE